MAEAMNREDTAVAATRPQASRKTRTMLAELAFVGVCPGLAFWMMHFTPIGQNGFLDPYVYTGYINNFVDLFERYGVTYYGVRFGLILPAHVTAALFGPIGGYFVLRYAYALVAGLPFYVLIRQRFGPPTATAAVSLLLTSPFFARTVLWDHPDASGVPFAFAGICLFLIEHRRRRSLDVCAGVCAGMALNSNIFVAAPLSIYLVVYTALWLLWRRSARDLIGRLLVFAVGIVAVTTLGAVYYWWRVGHADIFSVTFRTALWITGGGMASWRTPGIAWVARLWWVLTPVCLAVLAPLAWGRRRVEFSDAVMWASAAGATAFFYTFQFMLGGNSLELFYYFSYLLPFVFLLIALILGAIWSHLGIRTAWVALALLLTAAIGPWILYSFEQGLFHPGRFEQHLTIVGSTTALVLLWRWGLFSRSLLSLLATAALGLTFFSSFSAPLYSGEVNSRVHPNRVEMDVYRVALQFIDAIPRAPQRPGTIRFWYSNEPPSNSMQSIQSTYLWGYSKVQGQGRGLPYLEASELEIVRHPDVKWLGLLAEEESQLAVGRAALLRNGIQHVVVDRRTMTAGAYTLHFELLQLQQDL